MKDHLVMVAPDEDGDYTNLRYSSARGGVGDQRDFFHPVALAALRPERNAYHKIVEAWYVDERDVPQCVDMMTKNFPGREIQVLNLKAVHVRPPGELQTKTVSKNGILPA
jgi:hypothetical protein